MGRPATLLEGLCGHALSLSAQSIEVEYKDGRDWVFANQGGIGIGIVNYVTFLTSSPTLAIHFSSWKDTAIVAPALAESAVRSKGLDPRSVALLAISSRRDPGTSWMPAGASTMPDIL